MMEMGVASPSAQGQAMMSTLTAAIRAWASCGAGPKTIQTMKAITATAITAGTK